ncbi:helix-turn-helix transcriptional regulator [Kingella kingae]|uniref:S24 family peptidase n=1 Tax=Kingella kingae TaxID=504 RepID=UPI0018AD5A53|nr:S24 family peptidase [Kingella kingae]
MVDHTQTEANDGSYAIRPGNDVILKRLQRLPNKLMVISANPEYPPFEISGSNDNFAIIGKVRPAWPLAITQTKRHVRRMQMPCVYYCAKLRLFCVQILLKRVSKLESIFARFCSTRCQRSF